MSGEEKHVKMSIPNIVEGLYNKTLSIYGELDKPIYSSSDIDAIQDGLVEKRNAGDISDSDSDDDNMSKNDYFRVLGLLNKLKKSKHELKNPKYLVDKKIKHYIPLLNEILRKYNISRGPKEKVHMLLKYNFNLKNIEKEEFSPKGFTPFRPDVSRGRTRNRGRGRKIRVGPGRRLTRKKGTKAPVPQLRRFPRGFVKRLTSQSRYNSIGKKGKRGGKRRKTRRKKRKRRRKTRRRRR